MLRLGASLAAQRVVHPVRNWLSSLPAWKGEDLIPTVIRDVLGITSERGYSSEQIQLYGTYLRKWMIAGRTGRRPRGHSHLR